MSPAGTRLAPTDRTNLHNAKTGKEKGSVQRYGEWKLFVNDSMTSKKTVKLDGSRVRTDGSAAPSSLTLNPLQGVVLQKK